MAYTLQEPFKTELECLQKQQIIVPLGKGKTSEWCSNFVLVPKPNGKVCLCLGLARCNQALIRPVQRGPTLNNIFPRLTNTYYLTLIDTSSRYHSLKLDKNHHLNENKYSLKHSLLPRKSVASGGIQTHAFHIPGKHPNHLIHQHHLPWCPHPRAYASLELKSLDLVSVTTTAVFICTLLCICHLHIYTVEAPTSS